MFMNNKCSSKCWLHFDKDRLPKEFEFQCGRLFYKEAGYAPQEYELRVREDGADAWGASVGVPGNSFVRHMGENGYHSNWHYIPEKKDIWLTMVGTEVEYIHNGPDEEIEWMRYKAVEM